MRLILHLLIGLLLTMPIALSADASFLRDKSKDLSYFVDGVNLFKFRCSSRDLSINSNNLESNTQKIKNNKEQFSKVKRSIDLPFSWIISLIFICLLVGFLLGIRWSDYRNRRRHGGVRV